MKKKCQEATAVQNKSYFEYNITFHAHNICTCTLFYYPVSIICVITVLSYLLFIIQKIIVYTLFCITHIYIFCI